MVTSVPIPIPLPFSRVPIPIPVPFSRVPIPIPIPIPIAQRAATPPATTKAIRFPGPRLSAPSTVRSRWTPAIKGTVPVPVPVPIYDASRFTTTTPRFACAADYTGIAQTVAAVTVWGTRTGEEMGFTATVTATVTVTVTVTVLVSATITVVAVALEATLDYFSLLTVGAFLVLGGGSRKKRRGGGA